MAVDGAALAAGAIRLASGVSFLVDPLRANRWWGDPDEPPPTARLVPLRVLARSATDVTGLVTEVADAARTAARPPEGSPCTLAAPP